MLSAPIALAAPPTKRPTRKPLSPSRKPSKKPVSAPSKRPTDKPRLPTARPSKKPIAKPSSRPTRKPTSKPTLSTASVVNLIRQNITNLLQSSAANTTKGPLGPKFVRLAFHDCVGGCDGCVDLTNGDNGGLDIPINALAPIVSKYEGQGGVSRADIWAISALVACQMAAKRSNFLFPVNYVGRKNCETTQQTCYDKNQQVVACSATRGPNRDLPSADLTTSGVLQYFETVFSLTADETVAVMGAHTLGTASRSNSGFNGTAGWVNNVNALDNAYYAGLVGGNSSTDSFEKLFQGPRWDQQFVNNTNLVNIPNRFQWIHPNVNQSVPTIMLNADIGMVRDLTNFLNATTGEVKCKFACPGSTTCPQNGPPACPFASQTFNTSVEYKFNNTLWLNEFRDAYNKMLINGYSTTQCDTPPCVLQLK